MSAVMITRFFMPILNEESNFGIFLIPYVVLDILSFIIARNLKRAGYRRLAAIALVLSIIPIPLIAIYAMQLGGIIPRPLFG